MNAPVADALSEAEFLRLDALLSAAQGGAMSRDEVQGFFAALAMGPDEARRHEWIAAVVGSAEPPGAELVSLLERYRIATLRSLNQATLSIEARTTRTGRIDFSPWCQGFIAGANLLEWFAIADAEDLDELMFPLEVVADALPAAQRASYGPAQWRKLRREAEADLRSAVYRLRDYWAIVRSPPATVRREEPKIGRNDPCPCGGGRKFKQCHGR